MIENIRSIFKVQGVDNNDNKPEKKNDNQNKNQNQNNTPGKPPVKKKKNKAMKWVVGLLVFFAVLLLFSLIFGTNIRSLSYNDLQTILNEGTLGEGVKVWHYMYDGYSRIIIEFENDFTAVSGQVFESGYYGIYLTPEIGEVVALIINGLGAELIYSGPTSTPFLLSLILGLIPWILIFAIGYFIIKLVMDRQTNQMGFGKSQTKPQTSSIKFSDVAGYDEIKVELEELVDFLKDPKKYAAAGARTPKGVLLSGPPGTGKTLFAKAIAGEARIPFFSISGSDFVEMFVGVGASRVRSLFKNAKEIAPALIFIDELDAVGRKRGSGMSSNDEREQTLNQLLVEMDGFMANTGIIVIAATNRPDVLDNALKRPGRFDREIQLRLPDIREREAILIRHSRDKKFDPEIVWSNIAKRTPGFSGAELENVLNEAAILTLRQNKKQIEIDDIDEAIDRVIGGPSKSNNIMSLEEKKLVSYHEAGHAVIGLLLPKAQKVQKITIIPRGDAGGYVLMTPKKEKFIVAKNELRAQIVSYLGGRVSEEIFFGKENITTGAYSDLEEATNIAKRMVTEFGMSSLGAVQFQNSRQMEMYGPNSTSIVSETIKNKIDAEIMQIMSESYEQAYEIIDSNKDLLELFAEALMLKETINAEEIAHIFENREIPEEFYTYKTKQQGKAVFAISKFETKDGITIFAQKEEIENIKREIATKILEEREKQKLAEEQQKSLTSNKESSSANKGDNSTKPKK